MLAGAILPLLAVPAGMDQRMANFVSIVNIVALFIISTMLWRNTQDRAQKIGTLHDLVLYLGVMTISWFSCVPATGAGAALVKELKAARKADSVLNRK
jgi:hypothetical protein